VPFPGSKEAIKEGCTCPRQPAWPTIALASDCPLHMKLRCSDVEQSVTKDR
jgi:hypothetical protein